MLGIVISFFSVPSSLVRSQLTAHDVGAGVAVVGVGERERGGGGGGEQDQGCDGESAHGSSL
jgi:hypothetical protein